MKRAAAIAIAGLLAAAASYCVLYHCGTKKHREMMQAPAPELAWLKKEFQLSDVEFARIVKLHEGYMPRCAELCRRIAHKNFELQEIITSTNVDAKAVEHKLTEAGELRVECQKNMFNHFLEVSHQMPPEQGKRYLRWVQQRTLTPEHDMVDQHHGKHSMDHH